MRERSLYRLAPLPAQPSCQFLQPQNRLAAPPEPSSNLSVAATKAAGRAWCQRSRHGRSSPRSNGQGKPCNRARINSHHLKYRTPDLSISTREDNDCVMRD